MSRDGTRNFSLRLQLWPPSNNRINLTALRAAGYPER